MIPAMMKPVQVWSLEMVVGLRPVFVAHFLSLLLELEELLELLELLGLHCPVGYSGATDDPPLCGRLLVVLVQLVSVGVAMQLSEHFRH